MSILNPKVSVTLGLVFSVLAWLAIGAGFMYAFSQADIPTEPGTLSPRRFAMAMTTIWALFFSAVGCFLGIEGLIKKWFPVRAKYAVMLGAPIVVVIGTAIAWHKVNT